MDYMYYYRMDGSPYTGPNAVREFEKDFQNTKKRRIGFIHLSNGLDISTVWLGLNHRHCAGRPLIFETMVFAPDKGGNTCFEMARYSTLEEARLGHKAFVKRYKHWKSIEELLNK